MYHYMSTFAYQDPVPRRFFRGMRNAIEKDLMLNHLDQGIEGLQQYDANIQDLLPIGRAIRNTRPHLDIASQAYKATAKWVPGREYPTVIQGLDDKGRKVAKGLTGELIEGGDSNRLVRRATVVHPKWLSDRGLYT